MNRDTKRSKQDQARRGYSEEETVKTSVELTSYLAVYIRYVIPTSSELQESVALLAPSESLSSAFQFAVAASKGPTQLHRWTAEAGAPVAVAREHASRRTRLRARAADRMSLASFDILKMESGGWGEDNPLAALMS